MTLVYEDHDDEAASDIPVRRIKFTVNGEKKIAEVEPRLLLAHLIRREDVPRRPQRLKRVCTTRKSPKRSGKSRHGMPAR